MLILPTRYVPRLLVPVPERQWRQPSHAVERDQFGNPGLRTAFRVRARLDDGHVAWQGWFASRDDFDAFLWGIVTRSIHAEPALWRLPTPHWHPDLAPFARYEFATTVVYTTPATGALTNISEPADWNDASNRIVCISGGGSGGISRGSTSDRVSGGGGSALAYTDNFTWPADQMQYSVGGGGAGVTRNTTGRTAGNQGTGASQFRNSVSGTFHVIAGRGGAGNAVASGTACAGGAAGTVTAGSGNSGGAGGDSTANGAASGGGGAAGDTGAGVNGTNQTVAGASAGGNGGTVSAGSTGTGTAGASGPGSQTSSGGGNGSGLYNDGVTNAGPGGASGAAKCTSNNAVATSGSGGAYGAGTGGAMSTSTTGTTATSGTAGQGLFALIYTPAINMVRADFELPLPIRRFVGVFG